MYFYPQEVVAGEFANVKIVAMKPIVGNLDRLSKKMLMLIWIMT